MQKPMLALVPMWCLLPVGASACEALVAQIDAKIRASGVVNFTLVTMDAEAPSAGRVVGSCGLGKKKIVYTPAGGTGLTTQGTMGAPVVRGTAPPRPASPLLTECKPGYTGVDCRQRVTPAVPVEPKAASSP